MVRNRLKVVLNEKHNLIVKGQFIYKFHIKLK